MLAVQTDLLSRRYSQGGKRVDILALHDVSLEIEVGEVRGLLGPNGAGKTTLVKILCTALLPSSGTARVLGHDVVLETAAVRPLIGIVFGGDRGLYPNLTGQQNLDYWAALYGVPAREAKRRVSALLERVGLATRAHQPASGYSRGMKQRLHLARGLIANARVLFLDEPTIGMDPMATRDFRALIKELQSEGRTILLTTHDMAEAEALCDRVALIDHGRLLAVEKPSNLSQFIAKFERIDFAGGNDGLLDKLRRHCGVATLSRSNDGEGHRIELADGGAHQSVLSLLVETGITSIRTSRPSLEEVYVRLIGDRGLEV